MRKLIVLFFFSYSITVNAQSTLSFQSLNDVFSYAGSHSSTLKNSTQQSILAKYETLAAQLAIVNLKSDANFSATDNTRLTTTFLPAAIFGGPAGTFQKVTFGQQYVSSFNISPQIDILNAYSIAKVKIARANAELTNVNNLISKKNLYESIAGAYYNILSYEWQITVAKRSLANADTITQIAQNKVAAGISRSQDVNDARASQLSVEDKVQQLEIMMKQQYSALKTLCDINDNIAVVISDTVIIGKHNMVIIMPAGNLLQQQNEWQKKYYEANLNADKKWYLPTLSFFSNFTWQQFTNNHFFDNNPFLGSSYAGLKLTVPIVPDINKIASVKSDRINIIIAQNNLEHARLQDFSNSMLLQLDYEKALNSYRITAKIESLKEDTYKKNLEIYRLGILSSTDFLNSFNDWLNSRLNTAVQLANSGYEKAKIDINNSIK